MSRNIILSEEDMCKIKKSIKDCWICRHIYLNLNKEDNDTYSLNEDILEDYGMEDHLIQLIKKINYNAL